MVYRRSERKINQQELSSSTEKNRNLKYPNTTQTKQGLLKIFLKYFPYLLICILLFDRHNDKSSAICDHPQKTTTLTDSNLRFVEQKQQLQKQQDTTKDDIILKDKILNELQVMDWEIPSEIKEERHKECDGRKISSTGGFCLTTKSHI